MDSESLKTYLAACQDIARAAGAEIQKVAAEDAEATEKADGSPLTRADLASHETISRGLEALQSGLPVLSEEGDLEQVGGAGWESFWCVDPLDGTKEFVKGLDEYTVNIALVRDAVPALGVVYVPAQDVMYAGIAGEGASRAVGDAAAEAISANAVARPRSAVVSRSHLSDETRQFLAALGVGDVVSHGSSIKICAVAAGEADIYPRHGPTCLWDTAAGAAVARAAGARVVDLAGQPLSYNPDDGIKRPGFIVYPEAMDEAVQAAIFK
ncbi:MAG: 3'(2'),5'-bisphosphate nucleotidase CysQ [Phycisphaerae bacterium]|nr:3'(2'),5'-bisphosphate nucleotidase CysQ [Phycisphaerae bacterium]